MKRRHYPLPALTFLVCMLACSLLTGCGGSHSSGLAGAPSSPSPVTPAAGGQVRLAILWPALPAAASGSVTPRLIPAAANSIVVTITGPSNPSPQTLTRPSQGQSLTTTASFTNLIAGTYTVAAAAHPNVDGTGTAQAQASAPFTISAGQTVPLGLTLGSTIARVAVTPTPASVSVEQTVPLAATAFDSAGNIVLTSAFAWTSASPALATVDPNTGLVTGVSPTRTDPPISVQITAKEPESGVSGTGAVTVQPATGPITGVVEDSVNQGTIAGATVTISRAGVVVDTEIAGQDNREARFTSIALPAGVYTLAVSAPNYLANSVTVTFDPNTIGPGLGQNIGVISLTSTVGNINGSVIGEDDTVNPPSRIPLFGATVTLTPTAGGNAILVTTLADGTFTDDLVPVGNYSVVASLANGPYPSSAPRMVTITPSGSQTENFVLVITPIR